MINKSIQDMSVAGKQKYGTALVRALVAVAVIGAGAMEVANAAGQRSAESVQQQRQRNADNSSTRHFEQDAHATNMARLRAETSAENKRKNAAAKAAAEEAAAKAAAAQAAAAQTATSPVPVEPASKQ